MRQQKIYDPVLRQEQREGLGKVKNGRRRRVGEGNQQGQGNTRAVILGGLLSAQLEKKDAMHKMLLSFMEYLFFAGTQREPL